MISELFNILGEFLPKLILLITLLTVVVLGFFKNIRNNKTILASVSITGLALASICFFVWILASHEIIVLPAHEYGLFTFFYIDGNFAGGSLVLDSVSAWFSFIFCIGAIVTIFTSITCTEIKTTGLADYFSLILGAVLFASIVAAANNIIVFFLALETFSLCIYALVVANKNSMLSAEAAMKYLLFGFLCSAIMIYGFSFLYGYSNLLTLDSTKLSESAIKFTLLSKHEDIFALISVLIAVGLCFRLCVIPFHFWGPDVYQGSPAPVAWFISTVSKACGLSALLRLYQPIFKNLLSYPQESIPLLTLAFGSIAVISIVYSSFVALKQTDIKRLFAYASISHAGFLLLALSFINDNSLKAAMFYLTVFVFANLGAFWCLSKLINIAGGRCDFASWKGLGGKLPVLSALLFVFLISLAGFPPTAGFSAKFFIFQNLITEGLRELENNAHNINYNAAFYFTLVVTGLISCILSLFYYMKIIRIMCFEGRRETTHNSLPPASLAITKADYAIPVVLACTIIALVGLEPLLNLLN